MKKSSLGLPGPSNKPPSGRSNDFPFNKDHSGLSNYGGGKGRKGIDIINVNSLDSNKTAANYISEMDTNHFKFFYHGTTFQHASTIVSNGINVEMGKSTTDFGQGFYLSEDFNYAKGYGRQIVIRHSVLIFKVPLATWNQHLDSYGYDFGTKLQEWKDFVAFHRGQSKRQKVDMSGKKFVRGHVCQNKLKPGTSNQGLEEDPAMQVCLKDPEYAKTFIGYLSAVVSYNI